MLLFNRYQDGQTLYYGGVRVDGAAVIKKKLAGVYTTLAYGGRGLAYFTYFAPPVGGYRAAPVDQFGHETPTWHNLQNVNLQVQKLGPTGTL